MLGGFFTTDNRILVVDSMPAFLIDLPAPGAQPPVDKLSGCQEIQLEGTCCYSAACAKTDGNTRSWKLVSLSLLMVYCWPLQATSGWHLAVCKSSYCQFHFFSSLWWCLDCLLPVKFNRRWVRLTLLRLRFLSEWDSSERENVIFPYFAIIWLFQKAPRHVCLSPAKS